MSRNGTGLSEPGLWQLVESGRYRADFDAWSTLAAETGAPILDLGCGIGRVSHHLNRLGLGTLGLDRDPGLIADFDRDRPADSSPGIVADVARLGGPDSPLDGLRFRLVIAPQQLVQIIGGRQQRLALFSRLHELLEPGCLAAFAICEELPRVDIHYPGVPPDLLEVGGWVHSSMPVAIDVTDGSVTALRLRQSLGPDGPGEPVEDRVTLDRLDRSGLERELTIAGLEPCGNSAIDQTDRHMGSTLVLARTPLS